MVTRRRIGVMRSVSVYLMIDCHSALLIVVTWLTTSLTADRQLGDDVVIVPLDALNYTRH